jgi:ribosomal protein L18E
MRITLVLTVLFLSFAAAKAQRPVAKKPIDSVKQKSDTTAYVNQGKIAARKAFHRSLIFPGLGQIYNYGLVVHDVQTGAVKGKKVAQKIYILSKLTGLYAGGTLLVMSYADNRSNYKDVLYELQYRQANGVPDPDGRFKAYDNTEQLNVAKNIFKRNSQVVLISMVGLYGLAALDSYVTARLKYFNLDNNLSLKVSPSMINTSTMYGFNAAPSLKLTFKL